MSMTVTSEVPSGSERVMRSSLVMPIWWAVSTILSRPIACARRTATVLIELISAVVSVIGPE